MFAVCRFVLEYYFCFLALLSYPIISNSYPITFHVFHESSSEVGPVAKKLKELIWKAGPLRIFTCQVKMTEGMLLPVL